MNPRKEGTREEASRSTHKYRGRKTKDIIVAQHRIVLRAIEEGTLGQHSPYYGWSAVRYIEHLQVDTDNPKADQFITNWRKWSISGKRPVWETTGDPG
jgi:hypothetical protein